MKKEAKNNAVGFKLPKKIKIVGVEHDVVVVPDNTVYKGRNSSEYLGSYNYYSSEILINKRILSNNKILKKTFFHELAHGLYYYCGAYGFSDSETLAQCSAVQWCKSFDLRGGDELVVPKRVWMNERWFSVCDENGKFDGDKYEGIDYSKFRIKIGKPENDYNWMQILTLYIIWVDQFLAVFGVDRKLSDDTVFTHGLALGMMELFKFRDGL